MSVGDDKCIITTYGTLTTLTLNTIIPISYQHYTTIGIMSHNVYGSIKLNHTASNPPINVSTNIITYTSQAANNTTFFNIIPSSNIFCSSQITITSIQYRILNGRKGKLELYNGTIITLE